jgi:hypothetical protein
LFTLVNLLAQLHGSGLDKTQQNKLFFNGFSGSRSVSAGIAAKWLQNQVFSLVEVRHIAEHDGT